MSEPEGWYFDGEPLEQYGRVLESRDGWDDTPGLRGENTLLLGRHGERSRRKRYAAGVKPLAVAVHGVTDDWAVPADGTSQRARYEKNLDGLLRLIRARPGAFPVLRVYADGSRRTALCEVVNPITPSVTGDTYGLVTMDLQVPGSFWLDEDALTYQLAYNVAGANEQTIEVFGLVGQTAPCADPIVTVTGPCTTISVRDAVTGSGFAYGALTSGQSLVVDAGGFSALKGATNVLTDLTLFDGQLLEISAAPAEDRGPSLTISAPGKAAGFSVSVESRRAWLR